MHLDIVSPDIHGEAARLEALGARRVSAEALTEHGNTRILMEDPEGNEFCVCDGGASGAQVDQPPVVARASARRSLSPLRRTSPPPGIW